MVCGVWEAFDVGSIGIPSRWRRTETTVGLADDFVSGGGDGADESGTKKFPLTVHVVGSKRIDIPEYSGPPTVRRPICI